ncbi:SRPBCC domain-containing protein [Trujillonella humicola]|uniref:SRPBCC domain-containing protein n=1 Tax=Trujillonella humicola TaxID=3383699 RepID=UPI00390680B4
MSTSRVTAHLAAPRDAVYRALTDPDLIAAWRFPEGMTSAVERLGDGVFRVLLTYDDPAVPGKSGGHTDTYRARFARLVPGELVVEVDEFETDVPELRGDMTTTITLHDAAGGTALTAVHEGVPDGVPPEQNEEGWRMALARLARLLEA